MSPAASPKCLTGGNPKNNNFFTWEGFGKLWEWVHNQKWWDKFRVCPQRYYIDWSDTYVNPERFATAVYNFLKERGINTMKCLENKYSSAVCSKGTKGCQQPHIGPGDYVTYHSFNKTENGRVKALHPDGTSAWVVYHCNNNWDNYKDYTGALTSLADLTKGWE